MSGPSVGLALIVKDEEESLPRLLDSVRGAFDRVVLVDTGSTDKTVETFEAWAAEEVGAGRLGSYLADRFDWVDDFAAARTYAHARLGTDVECWADADDTIENVGNVRQLAGQLVDSGAGALICNYDYGFDQHGNVVCRLQRERLVRAGAGRWEGRVHEAQIIDGPAAFVDPASVNWIHAKQPGKVEEGRNLRILRKWERDEPENPRVLGYLGTEELARGKPQQALRWFRRYLKLKTGWDEERAQIHRKLAIAYVDLGRDHDATQTAIESMLLLPAWPDSYMTLAETAYRAGQHAKAVHWADEVLERGVPQTLLIINPLEYSVQPAVLKAGALADLGRVDEAIKTVEQALEIVPDHPVRGAWLEWRAARKAERTAASVIALADVLCAHDEQLRALAVLRNAPHFVHDHPQVVAWRSMLGERIGRLFDPQGYAEHYETGASKPEDMVADEDVLPLGDHLPRCGFLLEGLTAQAGAA